MKVKVIQTETKNSGFYQHTGLEMSEHKPTVKFLFERNRISTVLSLEYWMGKMKWVWLVGWLVACLTSQ